MPIKETIRVIQPGNRRVKIFIDFWNIVILARQQSKKFDVRIRWDALTRLIASETHGGYGDETSAEMAGCYIFGSFSRSDPRENAFINSTLDEFGSEAGLFFEFKERVRKQTSSKCKKCGEPLVRVSELGVDVLLIVEMIKHLTMKEHDYLSLVSGDRDYIPLLTFLKDQGQRVLHIATGEAHRDMRSLTWKQVPLQTRYNEFVKIHQEGYIIFHTPHHTSSLEEARHIAGQQGLPVETIDVTDENQLSDKDFKFFLQMYSIYVPKEGEPQNRHFLLQTVTPNLKILRDRLKDGSIDGKFPHIFRNGTIEAHRHDQFRWIRFTQSNTADIWKS